MDFPVKGRPDRWQPSDEQVLAWMEAYSGRLDIKAECRRARVWLQANPAKQKTARGMPRFLVSWFNRALHGWRESAAITPQERERAVNMLRAFGHCPHDPRCPDYSTCIGTLVRGWREREAGE